MAVKRHPRGSRKALLVGASVLGVLAAALAPAPLAAAADGEDLTARQRLSWSACDFDPTLECTTVQVPLDYAHPRGPHLGIAVSRLKSAGGHRRGVLLSFNGGPGGDGGLGRRTPQRLAAGPLHGAYDLVGFDPRGTGASSPLLCKVTQPTVAFDSRPTDASLPGLYADARATDQACAQAGGELRRTVNSATVARDMDAIRAALGERKLNVLAYGDSTYTTAVYGTLFPHRLDRSVLDSSRNPDVDWHGQYKSQAYALRANVDQWAAWTADRDGHFSLGDSSEGVLASVEQVVTALNTAPVGYLNRTAFDDAVGRLATDRTKWAQLGDLVGALRDRPQAPETVRLANAVLSPWSSPQGDTRPGTVEATTCENDWPTDLASYAADVREFRVKYPYGLGALRAQPWVCAFRSFTPSERPPYIRNAGYPKGLVVHAEGNPVLQYAGGQAMARRLGDRLLTVADDGGSDVYLVRGNTCVDQKVTRYLLTGALPAASDSTCAGAPRPAIPADDES
ncbi:alpha/beta fold hydrolase [Kitasatospora sp. NPDC051170]|uniref:alpha/beta fold hydrolase n=1 Tax=Kitasatospora sp. NPDC051170 TaxID=3364056 RepID=UPI0037A6410C